VNQLPPYSIDIPSPPPPIVKGPLTDSSSSDDSTRESLQHSSTSSASDSFPSPDPTTDPAVPDGVRIVLAESQLEDGKKWNEERIERRLRGDYERAGRALSELVRALITLRGSIPNMIIHVR
jgi:outer membrane protein insertion porin family